MNASDVCCRQFAEARPVCPLVVPLHPEICRRLHRGRIAELLCASDERSRAIFLFFPGGLPRRRNCSDTVIDWNCAAMAKHPLATTCCPVCETVGYNIILADRRCIRIIWANDSEEQFKTRFPLVQGELAGLARDARNATGWAGCSPVGGRQR